MRRVLIGLLAVSVAGLAQGPQGRGRGPFGPDGGPGPRFLGAEPGRPERVVKNAPYTGDLVTESTQTLADGNHIRQSTTAHLARDTEGRTRREQSLNGLGALGGSGRQEQAVFITDPVASVSYAMNPGAKTATKMSYSRAARGQRPSGPGKQDTTARPRFRGQPGGDRQNVKTEALGRQTFEGVAAEGTRTTLTIPAGEMGNESPIQVVTERWYSPELQTAVLTRHSDPRSGETVTRLSNVSRTEPSHSLFEVPADYKVSEGGRGQSRGAN